MRPTQIRKFESHGPYAIVKFVIAHGGEDLEVAIQPDADAEKVFADVNERLAASGAAPLDDEQLQLPRKAVAQLHTPEIREAVRASKKVHEDLFDVIHLEYSSKADEMANYTKAKAIADAARQRLIDLIAAHRATLRSAS